MAEILTKTRARNIFYGGSIFFVVVFIVSPVVVVMFIWRSP